MSTKFLKKTPEERTPKRSCLPRDNDSKNVDLLQLLVDRHKDQDKYPKIVQPRMLIQDSCQIDVNYFTLSRCVSFDSNTP